MSLVRTEISWAFVGGVVVAVAASGCGHEVAETKTGAATTPRLVPVTVAPLEHRAVERTVEVIGTLRGWEQVTLGSKRSGRVIKVHHDIGDRVQPGEPLVELDPTDARLGVQQAETKYLGELVKLGITEAQAENFVKQIRLQRGAGERPGGRRNDRQVPRSSRNGSRVRRNCNTWPVSAR